MRSFSLDLKKYGLEYLDAAEVGDLTDEDIRKVADALRADVIAPHLPWISFEPENVRRLLGLSTCRKCGRCCLPPKAAPGDPGVIVSDLDLAEIARNTRHSLKSLRKMTRVNTNQTYRVGAMYLPRPCIFFDRAGKTCKIHAHRPLICRVYPLSDSGDGTVTIDVQCDYGKGIFQKALKSLREAERKEREARR